MGNLINLGMLLGNQQDGWFTQAEDQADTLANTLGVKPNLKFIEWAVENWRTDPALQMMREGQRYYEADNDIHRRKRYAYGTMLEKAPIWMTNNTIAHGFIRKLVRQKVGYFLSQPVLADTEDEQLADYLADKLDKNFQQTLANTATNSITQGISWLQVYYSNGQMRIKRIPGSEVIPFWKDSDHTILEACIRVWETALWTNGQSQLVTHADFYTLQGVWHYLKNMDTGQWQADPTHPLDYSYTVTNGEGSEEAYVWQRIPFIPIKYSPDEKPLLFYVKDLIDEYDRRVSDIANTLEDEPDRIKIVKNYDGTDRREFVRNLKEYRTAFIRDNGDITTLDTSISTDAAISHLDRLRRDIYEFGSGVDTQDKDLGNASGVALKFVYSDLDMDCHIFQTQISQALDNLLWFWMQDMMLHGLGDHTDATVEWKYTTSMIINESERISDIKNSVGILSDKTLIANHPYVNNPQQEAERINQENQERDNLLTTMPNIQTTIVDNNGNEQITRTSQPTA